jgi:pyruvate dehydrogenase E1 component alpha subunit/2-oxoisovalerate dehydrogenase E1 component
MFDAELYRSRAEVEEWRQRDPITSFVHRLKAWQLLTDDDVEATERVVARDIENAVAFAEAGTWEPVSDLTRFVYSERRTA